MSTLIHEHRSTDQFEQLRGDVDVACRTHDAELWFAETPDGVAQAQQLCRTCPLQAACLAGALERREPWGVWGGELFERGVPIARKRRPGRPRKDDDLDRHAAEQALADRLADSAGGLELLVAEVVPGAASTTEDAA